MATNRVKLEDVINEAKTTLESGNPDRAVALCNYVFKYYPRCLEVSRVLGETYTEKRLLDEADQLFVFVLSADPQDVLGYVDRGFIAYERGQPEEAIMYYERALELDSSIKQLREELLRLYHEQPAPGRNRIRLTKAGLANGRLRDGFYGQAIEEYNAVLRATPNRLDVQVGLMEAYWRNRDYPRAEKLATDLLQAHPDLVKANLILWHIYGVRRNQDRAAPYLEKAHALDPLNLLAERLFEDAVVSNDAMRYISMLGIPAIPAPDTDARLTGNANLVPDWANADRNSTDVQLGLRPDVPSPLADTPSNLGIDLMALLNDTQNHVNTQQAEAEKQDRNQALAGLDELRSEAYNTQGDVFNLFEEIEPAKVDLTSEKVITNPGAAFDLGIGVEPDNLSMFEEVAAPGAPLAAPFRFDEPENAVAPFDLFSDDIPTRASFEMPSPPANDNGVFDLFGEDGDAFAAEEPPVAFKLESSRQPALPEETGLPTLPFEPALEPVAGPTSLDEAAVIAADHSAFDLMSVNEADHEKPQAFDTSYDHTDPHPPAEVAMEVQPVPEDQDSYLNFLLAAIPAKEVNSSPTLPSLAVPELEHHAFHKRNEQGPLPDFVTDQAPTSISPIQVEKQDSAESIDLSASPLAASFSPVSTDEPGLTNQSPQPQQHQEQENDAMPIKRGPQDDNDVFDWEREELPDYLQAFAMDDDEVAKAGLASSNPVIADVNTPPARIRPRDNTGAPGDLPDWLNPLGGGIEAAQKSAGFGAKGEQIDLSGPARPGGGSLPNWLDATDLDSGGAISKQVGAFGKPGEQENFGGLEPFNLGVEDGFGGPPPPPPAPAPYNIQAAPMSSRGTAPQPPKPMTNFGEMGMEDISPFNLDDNFGGFESIANPPAAPGNRSPFGGTPANFEPPTPPVSRSTPPPPDTSSFNFGGDLDMGDLVPFSLDDGGGMPLAMPPVEAPQRQTPPPRPAAPPDQPPAGRGYSPSIPQPSFLPPEDMGDLMPFSLDDGSFGAPPAPTPRQSAPPPAPPAPAPKMTPLPPYNPFEPGANTTDFQSLDLGGSGLSAFSLDNQPTSPPARPAAPSSGGGSFGDKGKSPFGNVAPSPFEPVGGPGQGDDFDLMPFSLSNDIPGIFEDSSPRGSGRLGLNAMDPLDTLDEQPFRSERRSNRSEPEIEVGPGEERVMIGRSLVDRIKQGGTASKTEEQGQSLFEKLKQRRQQQDEERAQFSPPPVVRASNSQEPDVSDLVSFEEIERQANQAATPATYAPPQASNAPTTRDMQMQAEAFDLTDLGLNQDLDDEAFNLSLEETLPSSQSSINAEPANSAAGASGSYDFEPFDLGNIVEDVQPQLKAAPAPLAVQAEALSFPEPAQPAPSNSLPAKVAPAPVPSFDFDQATSAAPDFSLPAEPMFPFPVRPEPAPATPPVTQAATPVAPTPVPVPQPLPVNLPPAPAQVAATPPVSTPVAGNGSTDLVNNLQLADQYFQQQDFNQSISYFNSAIKAANPEDLKNVVNRLKQIVVDPAVSPRYHRVLGDAYKKQGLFQAALSEYSKALGPAVGSRK